MPCSECCDSQSVGRGVGASPEWPKLCSLGHFRVYDVFWGHRDKQGRYVPLSGPHELAVQLGSQTVFTIDYTALYTKCSERGQEPRR